MGCTNGKQVVPELAPYIDKGRFTVSECGEEPNFRDFERSNSNTTTTTLWIKSSEDSMANSRDEISVADEFALDAGHRKTSTSGTPSGFES